MEELPPQQDRETSSRPSTNDWSLVYSIIRGAKRILISVPIILLPILLFIMFNESTKALPDPLARSEMSFDAAFLFSDRFRNHLSRAMLNWPMMLGLFLSVNAIGGWLTFLSFATILDAIAKGRTGILESAKSIKLLYVSKFLFSQFILYVCYLLLATLFYVALYQFYQRFGVYYTHYSMVVLVLIVPLHFGLTSMYSLILLLARDRMHEWRLLQIAMMPKNLWKLFLFYAVRLALEVVIGLSIYFALRTFISDSLAVVAGGLVALLVPFAFLRVSSVIFQLTILSSDSVAQELVGKSLRNC
jgi:hypothetical protein